MLPSLRSVFAQGSRSIGYRRTFSSSSGSKGEMSIYEAMKSGLVPSFKTFKFTTWAMYGYMAGGSYELYKFMKAYRKCEKLLECKRERRSKARLAEAKRSRGSS